jgi:hypothetical protein
VTHLTKVILTACFSASSSDTALIGNLQRKMSSTYDKNEEDEDKQKEKNNDAQ